VGSYHHGDSVTRPACREQHFANARSGSGSLTSPTESEAAAQEQATAQEASLLQASVDMLHTRIKELTSKTDVDRSVVTRAAVSRAFPSWDRSILTEIYLCHACSYHHEVEDGNPGQEFLRARDLDGQIPGSDEVGRFVSQLQAEEERGGDTAEDGGDFDVQ
jgi:hypothetical protein